jgi:hypothetical protein
LRLHPFSLNFFCLGPSMPCHHFPCLNSHWIFKFISFLGLSLKLPKLDYPEYETGTSGFLSLAKFGHEHMPPCLLVKLVY